MLLALLQLILLSLVWFVLSLDGACIVRAHTWLLGFGGTD